MVPDPTADCGQTLAWVREMRWKFSQPYRGDFWPKGSVAPLKSRFVPRGFEQTLTQQDRQFQQATDEELIDGLTGRSLEIDSPVEPGPEMEAQQEGRQLGPSTDVCSVRRVEAVQLKPSRVRAPRPVHTDKRAVRRDLLPKEQDHLTRPSKLD